MYSGLTAIFPMVLAHESEKLAEVLRSSYVGWLHERVEYVRSASAVSGELNVTDAAKQTYLPHWKFNRVKGHFVRMCSVVLGIVDGRGQFVL